MKGQSKKKNGEARPIKRISSDYEIKLWRMHPEESDWNPKRTEFDKEHQNSEENLKATYWG
ncbi:MAG: hypothetical protein JXA41_03915 [Deltaproteobacteria bacterium]|nr:hypothetical protein [Deltaproteobacteria bacterium]